MCAFRENLNKTGHWSLYVYWYLLGVLEVILGAAIITTL